MQREFKFCFLQIAPFTYKL